MYTRWHEGSRETKFTVPLVNKKCGYLRIDTYIFIIYIFHSWLGGDSIQDD